jgi:WD40 repeat protein
VNAVAFSPDGRTFLTVGPRQARLWRTADTQPLGPPLPHPGGARPDPLTRPGLCAAFDPSGARVATGGDDGTVRLWDTATGAAHGSPLRATGPVLAVAFSPDGRTLLSGSLDGGAQLWDVADGRQRGPVLRHRGAVRAVAFSADGRLVATGGTAAEPDPETGGVRRRGGEARLWDARSGRSLGEPLAHPGAVWYLAFGPGGRTLLTVCEDGGARRFAVATGSRLGRPAEPDGAVTAVAISRDGTAALSTAAGGPHRAATRLWAPPPEANLPRLLLQPGGLSDIVFCADGRDLLTSADDRTVRQWKVTGERRAPDLADPKRVVALAFHADGHTILTAAEDGRVQVRDRATHDPVREFATLPVVASAAFSPDGRAVLIGGKDGAAGLWETAAGLPLGPRLPHTGPVGSAAFSPDGRLFATAGPGGVRVWGRETCELLRAWSGQGAKRAAFYPGAGRLLLVVDGGTALDWDVETGRPLGPPAFHPPGGIDRVAFSPDGRSVLIADADRVARLWDLATGRPLGPAAGREGSRAVAFSADWRLMAVGDWDGRIALWEPPAPVEGTAECVRLTVEVLTGLELDARPMVHALGTEEWNERRRRLKALGGPPAGLRSGGRSH